MKSFVGRDGGSCGRTKRGEIVRREGRRALRENEKGRKCSSGGTAGAAREQKGGNSSSGGIILGNTVSNEQFAEQVASS